MFRYIKFFRKGRVKKLILIFIFHIIEAIVIWVNKWEKGFRLNRLLNKLMLKKVKFFSIMF